VQNLLAIILILVAQVEGGMAWKGGIHGCKSMDFFIIKKKFNFLYGKFIKIFP
jgi:hypothetical protein